MTLPYSPYLSEQPHSWPYGLILAGGRSRRMGSPKALLPLQDGQTLLAYHLQAMQACTNTVLLAAGQHTFTSSDQPRIQVIADALVDVYQGPLSGVLAGLNHVATHHATGNLLVWSCDSLLCPSMVNSALAEAQRILTTHPQVGACYLRIDARDYPLLGIYTTQVAADLQHYLAQGERRVMPFLQHIQARSVTVAQPQLAALANVNTPEQFIHAQQQLFSMQESSV